jgi:hypothetical protein
MERRSTTGKNDSVELFVKLLLFSLEEEGVGAGGFIAEGGH